MTTKEIYIKKMIRLSGIIVSLILFFYLAYIFIDIIVIVTISLLIAMIFNPLVDFLEEKGLPRLLSVFIVIISAGSAIGLGIWILIPKIMGQFNTILITLSKESVENFSGQLETFIKKFVPFVNSSELVVKIQNLLTNSIYNVVNNLSTFISSILSLLTLFVIVPFIIFFFLKDRKTLTKGIINIMPNRYFEVSYWVIRKISIQLGRFVRGWILDAFLVGFLSALGLSILGINNSVSIGVVAGIGHLIPYFGPIIGGIPAIIISVVQFGDLSMLPSILVMFLIIYTIDNGFIQPNVFSKSTDFHPITIIVLIIAGSKLLGVFGMLLAIPTATVVKTAAKEIYNGYKNYKIIKA
ncbi:MAG: AI-2E family transporter [Melioribacteraceae bacterium]|nr:AI-2E family transporter [Melioribacteraceae bacterium]